MTYTVDDRDLINYLDTLGYRKIHTQTSSSYYTNEETGTQVKLCRYNVTLIDPHGFTISRTSRIKAKTLEKFTNGQEL